MTDGEVEVDVLRVKDEITASVTARYEGVLSAGTIERVVSESYAALAERAKITDFLPLLTERAVHDHLRGALQVEGAGEGSRSDAPTVLLVCGSGAGLGLIAAALLGHMAGNRVRVRLAAQPLARPLSPVLVEATRAAGLEPEGFGRERCELNEEVLRAADVLVTMTGGDACPVVPGKRYVDWRLETPSPGDAAAASALLEDMRAKVTLLLSALLRPGTRAVVPL